MHVIKGYSNLNIPIKFIPNEIGYLELPLIVYFENYLHSPPTVITLRFFFIFNKN